MPVGDALLYARDERDVGRRLLLPAERHAVAVHESVHALVAMCEHANPVAKVTTLPAGQILGVTEQLPLG